MSFLEMAKQCMANASHKPVQKNGEPSTVPLNQTVIDTLRTIPRRLDSDYVFTGAIPGQPFSDLKRQFEKAVSKAGLEGVTFHTLTYGSKSSGNFRGRSANGKRNTPSQIHREDNAIFSPLAETQKISS